MDRLPLYQRVALVTGAGSGIGRAVALALAGSGADVAVTSRAVEQLADTVHELEGCGVRALGLTSRFWEGQGAADALVDTVIRSLGRLDVVVNNAAVAVTEPALTMTEADWDETFTVNVRGPFLLSRAAALRMDGGGSIINLSSTFAFTARPGRAAYAASKSALNQLTKALAVEWAPLGIRVNAVAPCATNTPTRADILSRPEIASPLIERIPMGRVAEPEEVADAVVFLAGPSARFITGHILMVDGGWTAW